MSGMQKQAGVKSCRWSGGHLCPHVICTNIDTCFLVKLWLHNVGWDGRETLSSVFCKA